MDARRRIIVRSLLVIATTGFLVGITAGILGAPDGAGTTQAALFTATRAQLVLSSPTTVDGFLGGTNLAPGDLLHGQLQLSTNDEAALDVLHLSFRVNLTNSSGANGLRDALIVKRLSYGRDDLLTSTDGGRNLTGELDVDHDGRVSLSELQRGANDLPAPRHQRDSGTGFIIDLQVDSFARRLGAGPPLGADFEFTLSDISAPAPG